MTTPSGRRPTGRLEVCLLAALAAALGVALESPRLQAATLDGAAYAVMEGTTQQVLEENPDGQGINWSIPETGHSGTVIPTQTYRTSAGETCREYQQIVSLGGRTWAAHGTSCRNAGGGWRRIAYSGLSDIGGYRAPQRTEPPRTGYVPRYGYGYDPRYDYGYDYGNRPYYPRSGLGLFFGFGKGHSYYGHGDGHSKKHRSKKHRSKKHDYKKEQHQEKERHTSKKHIERKKHQERKKYQERKKHDEYDSYRQHRPHEGHSGQWQKSRDR